MRLSDGSHLTYCGNVHPTSSLEDARHNLRAHAAAVKKQLCPTADFGIGLWLPHEAAETLADPQARSAFARLLQELGLYVFTLNGFPYGAFHKAAVKERVYQPDWRDPRRLRYSNRLAELMVELLPDGVDGSLSTLPGAFKPLVRDAEDARTIADGLLRHALHLHELRERSGKNVVLAIEPEPYGLLETIDETVAFFDRELRSERALTRLAELGGLSRSQAAAVVSRHIGVCLDACHAAVEFEDPVEVLKNLRSAQVLVGKLQVSSALRLARVGSDAPARFAPYLDPVYLHQVVERRGSELTRYLDLPDALAALAGRGAGGGEAPEWRVHFHVPVFLERLRGFASTQDFLRVLLAEQRARPFTSHLEVETYTWDVLPEEARGMPLEQAIVKELRFCLSELGLENQESQEDGQARRTEQ